MWVHAALTVNPPGWASGMRSGRMDTSTLFKYKLHADTEMFEKAYGYIKQYC